MTGAMANLQVIFGNALGRQQVKSLQIMQNIQTVKVFRREGATPANSNKHRRF